MILPEKMPTGGRRVSKEQVSRYPRSPPSGQEPQKKQTDTGQKTHRDQTAEEGGDTGQRHSLQSWE